MKIDKNLKLKWDKFTRDKRAFTSFIILSALFIITAPAEILCNVRPILLVVDGKTYIPILFTYSEIDFGGTLPSEPDYLSKRFKDLLNGQPEDSIFLSTDKKTQRPFGSKLGDFEDEDPVFSIGLNDFEDDIFGVPIFCAKRESIVSCSCVIVEFPPSNFADTWEIFVSGNP